MSKAIRAVADVVVVCIYAAATAVTGWSSLVATASQIQEENYQTNFVYVSVISNDSLVL